MFNWLVLSIPVIKAMAVVGNHPLYTRAQLEATPTKVCALSSRHTAPDD